MFHYYNSIIQIASANKRKRKGTAITFMDLNRNIVNSVIVSWSSHCLFSIR